MSTVSRAYDQLSRHLREMSLVASCQEVLAWDELTCLPDQATEHRARQLAYLAGLHHALAVDPRLDDWLAALDGSPLAADPHGSAAVNIREARRQHARHMRLPRSLIEQLARVAAVAQHEWAIARRNNEFARFAPCLTQIVALKQEEARCLVPLAAARNAVGQADERLQLYDALLAEYEPGLHATDVAALFDSLGPALSQLLREVLDWQQRPGAELPTKTLHRPYPTAGQRALCDELVRAIGFDVARGRLDTAVHPFTTQLGPHDCRLAIRFEENNLGAALFALLHELGHGLYDQGLPADQFGVPAGEAISLGVHESQARLWENCVGRSRGFWRFFLPWMLRAFPAELAGVTPEAVWREANRVQPGTHRVEADEVTYNLHIVLRFELEQQLLSGELQVADIPATWDHRCATLLGIRPETDRDGCLQDGHWSAGQFGYFSTYTIGNVLAAQIFDCIQRDLGDQNDAFAAGDFQPLRAWLHQHLFRHGKSFSTLELTRRLCTDSLSPEPLINSLRRRHEQLWS